MFILGFTACAGVDLEQEDLSEDKIIGGELENREVATVKLTGNGFICTGTLIAPQVVLTAAHCMTELDQNTDRILSNPLIVLRIFS